MDEQKTRLFVSEINLMLDYCFFSFNQFNKVLKQIDTKEDYDLECFWYYSQTFITYAANLSKLLWASRNKNEKNEEFRKRKEFRDSLRQVLGISDKSILKNKKLRNRFEHLDEDLDTFKSGIVMSKNFGSVTGLINIAGEDYDLSKEKQLRHYDQYTRTLYLYGEKMNLQELYNEIKELSEKVAAYEEANDELFYPITQQSGLRPNMQNDC